MEKEININEVVVNKQGEEGKIIRVDDHIHVAFVNKEAKFQLSAFVDGFLVYKNKTLQKPVEEDIQKNKLEQQRLDEERHNAEVERNDRLRRERALLAQNKNKKRKNR